MKLYLTILLLLFSTQLPTFSQHKLGEVKCIVIDAGHGGKDYGATGGEFKEKDITLSVATKLGKLLKDNQPHIKVVYTRTDDTFIMLRTRCSIANRAKADLFISIHANAAKNLDAHGTETFIMGVDKTGANREVVERENDVVTAEADYANHYDGYAKGSPESHIISAMTTQAYQSQSLAMANYVQNSYAVGLDLDNRGVKQAGFFVLKGTAMPSILTEVGFISNAKDRQTITTAKGQQKIAQLLYNAIVLYIGEEKSVPKKNTPAKVSNNDVSYRVLAAESTKQMIIDSRNFGPFVSVVEEVFEKKTYKYYIENMNSYKEALLLHQKIVTILPKATIKAFRGAKLITLSEARKDEN